ncbi:unnamed protein product [Alopecurus aequalis]
MSIAVVFYLVTLLAADGVSRVSAAAPTDPTEAAAMRAIAKSTGADRSLGWGVKSADPCDGTWSGVHCDKDLGHVTAISASHAGLDGTLSGTDLVDLKFLSELDLSFNNLGDDLPILPRRLNLLTTLNLRSNSFSNMPKGFFGSFPALETVVLDDNVVLLGDITEVPPCRGLRSFSANNSLSLARNEIWGDISPSFGKNSKIKFLDVSRQDADRATQNLTWHLDFVSGMTALVEIHVAGNAFYGPLPDVSALASLKVFDAADNQLCGPVKFPPGVAVNVGGNANIGKSCQ